MSEVVKVLIDRLLVRLASDTLGQTVKNPPLRLGLSMRRHRAIGECDVRNETGDVFETDSFIPARRRQNDVTGKSGLTHAEVHRHGGFQFRPQLLSQQITASRVPEHITEDRQRKLRGITPPDGKPSTVERFRNVLFRRTRLALVAVFGVAASFRETAVDVVPQPRGNEVLGEIGQVFLRLVEIAPRRQQQQVDDAQIALHGQHCETFHRDESTRPPTAACFSDVAGHRRQQNLRALQQIAVVKLARSVLRQNQGAFGTGELTGEPPNRRRRNAGDPLHLFGPVLGVETTLEAGVYRFDRDRIAVVGTDQPAPLQRRPQVSEHQTVRIEPVTSGRRRNPLTGLVPEIEDLVSPSFLDIRGPQESTVVASNQEDQVRLLAHVVAVLQSFFENHLHGGERERGIAAGTWIDPQIGMDR